MLNNIEAVIFDLDGTLVDSMWMWKEIDIEYLGSRNLELPEDLQKAIEGMSFSETADYFKKRFQLTESVEEMKAEWISMAQKKYETEVPLKPGVEKFLEFLKSKKVKMGIATSNGLELVRSVVKAHNLEHWISSIHTCCEVALGKPAPDIYLKVAQDLQVPPEKCLVFEDVEMGIQAGLNAKMRVCAVEDRFSVDQEAIKKEKAHYYIRSYEDILNDTYQICR